MPCVKLQVSAGVTAAKKDAVLRALSTIVAETLGKPERYVMAILEESAILMSGTDEAAAFVDLRSIGNLNLETNARLTRKICAVIGEKLDIAAERIFLTFTDVPAENWGWNNQIFG